MRLPRILRRLMNQDQSVAKAPQPKHEQQTNGHVAIGNESSSTQSHLLSGQTALITGAGRNIGRGIALEMAAQGANIVFTDIDKERTVRLEKELRGLKMNASGIVSDVSNPHDIDSLLGILTQERLSIDILVNNAGFQCTSNAMLNVGLDQQWQTTFSTNVFGPMHLTQAIAQGMQGRGRGAIIFITSIHQWMIGRLFSYGASKAALGMIIKELAVELAPFHIRVNGIAPGWVEEDDEGKTLVSHYSLLHRTSINPAYIGRAAVYLASDYFSKFTTGAILKIDDGLSLVNHLSNNQKATP